MNKILNRLLTCKSKNQESEDYNFTFRTNEVKEKVKYMLDFNIADEKLCFTDVAESDLIKLDTFKNEMITNVTRGKIIKKRKSVIVKLKKLSKGRKYNHYLYIKTSQGEKIVLVNNRVNKAKLDYTIEFKNIVDMDDLYLEIVKVPKEGKIVRQMLALENRNNKVLILRNNYAYYNLVIDPMGQKNTKICLVGRNQEEFHTLNEKTTFKGLCSLDYKYVIYNKRINVNAEGRRHDESR